MPCDLRGSPNVMVFRPEDADTPFVTRNEEILEMLAPQFEAEMEQRYANQQSNFIQLVLATIQRRDFCGRAEYTDKR